MIVNIGELNKRVKIQTLNAQTKDSFGGSATKSFTDYKTVYAKVQPYTSGEMIRSNQPIEKLVYKILIRYDSMIDHTSRIIFQNKTFEIRSVINFESRNQYLQLLAEEIR